MSVHSVPIGDVVEKVSTWNPARELHGDFDYIDLSAVDQASKRITAPNRIPKSEAPSRARQIVRTGDVLVSTVRPNLNGVAKAVDEHDGMTASTGFCVLRSADRELDSNYLFQWVRSPAFVDDMVRKATGASYPAVSDRIIKDSEIPLLPLDEQKRIAAILDKADQLRQKRRQAIALLDSLTQSIFLEMFGDPLSESSSLDRVPMKEVTELINGDRSSNYPSQEELVENGVLFLNTTNISDDGLDLGRCNYITTEKFKKLGRGKLNKGDIVITLRGSLGQAAIFDCNHDTGFINAQMMIIRSGQRLDQEYLLSFLKLGRTQKHLKRIGSGSAVPQLTSKQMGELQIPLPPKELQVEFSRRMTQLRHKRRALKLSEQLLETSFSSLQHRAFSGQL